MPLDEGAEVQVQLPNAATTADVHRRVRELTEDPGRLAALFREGSGA
jgi:hypothetical protein